MNNWSKFLPIKDVRLWAFLFLVHLTLSSIIGWYTPIMMNKFFLNTDSIDSFQNIIWVMLGLFSLEYLNRFGYQLSTAKLVQAVLRNMRTLTFTRWLMAPLKNKKDDLHSDDFPMGEVMARIMSDSEAVRELISSGSFTILIDLVFVISSFIGFLTIKASIGFTLFGLEVIFCLLLLWGSKKMAVVFMEIRKLTGFMSRDLADLSNGLNDLYYTPHDHYALKRGEKISEDFLKTQLKANFWDASYYSAAESLYPILLALVLLLIPNQEWAQVAILAVLIDLIQKSISPLKEITSKVSNIQRAKTGLIRINDFLNLFKEVPERKRNLVMPVCQEFKVHIKNFSYGAEFALKNIDFTLKPGETLAIVGFSGSGKSTILKLLSGMHGSFEGSILWNNEPHTVNDLQALVSLVDQDSHLFTSSVAFNLSFDSASSLKLVDFWNEANARIPYLQDWGINLETQISPQALSHGQKQLLSGLRALYLKKPIILLDEISSGLDSKLDKALRDLFILTQTQCITIVVTHRLETILNSHEIILMENGEAKAKGNAKNLEKSSLLFGKFLKELKGQS